MWMRVRLSGLASAALVGLALATIGSAQASVMDCIETVAPPELEKAVKDAAKAAQCVGQAAAGDAAMIAAIGAITALRAGGGFSSTEECLGLIDSTIGKLLAKALVESGLANKPPFAPVASQLQAMADGSTSPTFTELASQFEPVALLLSYMTCGCQIAGLDNELSNIANAYVGHVEGCAEFLSDAGEFAVNAIESGTDALAEGLKTFGHFVGGILEDGWNLVTSCFGLCDDDEPDCPQNVGITKSAFGVWSTKTIYQTPKGCGNWFCDEGGVLQTKPGPDGQTLYTCTFCHGKWALDSTGTCAPCGGTAKKISSDNMCLLAQTSAPNSSGAACLKGPEQQSCCQPGQKMKPQGKWDGAAPDCSAGVIGGECSNVNVVVAQCKAACDPPKYFDTATGSCTKCDFDSVPVYLSADSSIAQCKQCPLGLNGFGQKCEPCGPGQVVWTLTPPKKQQKQPGSMVAAPPKKEEPRATQKQVGPIAAKPSLDTTTQPPAPPPGTTMTKIPGGPIGGLVEGGRCMACPENWFPVYYYDPQNNSLGYCKECPPGTYRDVPKLSQVPLKEPITGESFHTPKQRETKCVPLDCKAGLDPHNPHACRPPPEVVKPVVPVVPDGAAPRPCPPGTRRVGGDCMPPASTLVPKRSLKCPSGQVPNAAQTACVKVSRTRPRDRIVSKTPGGQTAIPAKRRQPQWPIKRRPGFPTMNVPIPIPR